MTGPEGNDIMQRFEKKSILFWIRTEKPDKLINEKIVNPL